MAKKNFIIDTNVFLSDSECLTKFDNNDIFIPVKVLEELDKHKKRQDSVGFHARQTIKKLDALRDRGSLSKGVRLGKGLGVVKVLKVEELLLDELPMGLSHRSSDHLILAGALAVKQAEPKRKCIVVSQDINMRVIADALGLLTQDYVSSQVVDSRDVIFEGFTKFLVDDFMVEEFYDHQDVWLYEEDAEEQGIVLHPNEFVMLVSVENEKKTAIARFDSWNKPILHLSTMNEDIFSWGCKPRNKEQKCGLDLLLDDQIPLVSLIGRAGSGKTLMAILAGLEQVLGNEKGRYNRIIISRPIQTLGKDIGYLPGTMEEKMAPWMKPIFDNMQYIMGTDKTMLEMYLQKGVIEIEALAYIRGRSISDAFVIIDEAQNLTAHEVKTIITRIGENTKIVLTGDIEQIDNVYTNETSNGLTYAVEKLKHSKLSGHITFKKGERSKLATEASKLL
jgi:PhoH-like ATPase|tara:strand:- start:4905 stop:6251 length:1347 start_codon:yes stop_codon:yes gene_type:complete